MKTTAINYLSLCVECVNSKHGFGDEQVRKHSCDAFGVCDDCNEAKQVATYQVWQTPDEELLRDIRHRDLTDEIREAENYLAFHPHNPIIAEGLELAKKKLAELENNKS